MPIRIGILEGVIRIRDDFSSQLNTIAANVEKQGKRIEKAGRNISDVGTSLTRTITLPIIAIGGAATKMASDFESSFAGVRKTVDATEAQFASLEEGFRRMAAGPDPIPVNVNELNKIGEAAGQLGIKTDNILSFSRVMADLGATTNLSSEQAASSLARLANITQMPQENFDRLGSTIVALGNNFATTEAEIVEMSLRIAGAGKQVGLTEAQILAVGTALSSLGINAEAGGSAISKVIINIALAVSKGGRELQNFASIAGQSTEEFSRRFKEDAAGALNDFITGLGNLQSRGGDVLAVLDKMGITEVRMRDALLRAAGAGDILTRALDLSAKAWSDNNALTKEAEQRYKTFESQLTITWNKIRDVGITFGTALLPVLRDGLSTLQIFLPVLSSLAETFADLPSPIKTTIVIIAGLAAAIGPVVFVTGQLITAWGTIAANAPKVVAAIKMVTSSLVAQAAILGTVVFLALDTLIRKWGEASEAAIRYTVQQNSTNERLIALNRIITEARSKGIQPTIDPATFAADSARLDKLRDKLKFLQKELEDSGGWDWMKERTRADIESDIVNVSSNIQSLRQTLGKLTVTTEDATESVEGLGTGFGTLSEEAEDLRSNWLRMISQSEQLREAALQGEPAYEVLARRFQALNEATEVGAPQLARLGEQALIAAERVEIALKKIELTNIIAQLNVAKSLAQDFWNVMEGREIDFTLPTIPDDTIDSSDFDKGVLKELERIDEEYRRMFGDWDKIHEEYLEGLQRAFASTFTEIFTGGTVDFEDLFRDLGKLGGQILGEALAAELIKVMEGGKLSESLTRLRDMWSGVGGTLALVGVVGSNIANANNSTYAAVGAAVGAAIGAALGALTMTPFGVGVGAKWGAVIGSWLGSMIKTGSPEFFGAMESELGKITIGKSQLGGGANVVAKAFGDDLREAMARILDQIGGTLESLGSGISLKLKEDKLSVFIDGLAFHFKQDIEGGISFALTEALKRADISGASQTFISILQSTTARSLEQISEALDFGKWYERLRLGDVAADLTEKMHAFGAAIRRAIEFGLDLGPINQGFAQDIQNYRNNILGIIESEEDRIRRQSQAFNDWIKITEAEQSIRKSELQLQKSTLSAEIEILRAEAGIDKLRLDIQFKQLEAEYGITKAEWEILNAKLQMLAAIESVLITVEGILSGLPNLISDSEIQNAINRIGKGKGGGIDQAKQDLERLNDLFDQASTLFMTDYQSQLKAINDKWNEAIPLAHGNIELLSQINEWRQKEIDLLNEQKLLGFSDQIKDFISGGGSGSGLVDRFNAINDKINELGGNLGQLAEDLGLTGFQMLFFWQQILSGAEKMKHTLAFEGLASLSGNLASLVRDEQLRHELLLIQATIEFDLKMAQYRMEFDMLKSLGYLTAAQLDLLQSGLNNIAQFRDLIIASTLPVISPPGSGGGGGNGIDEYAQAIKRLRDIQARSLDPFSSAIKGVVDEFAELRRVLGWTTEVQAAYAQEIQRVLTDQLQSIRRLQEEMSFRADAPIRTIDQFRLAQQRLNESVSALRGGDLSQIGRIPDLAKLVLDLIPSSKANESRRFIFARVQSILDEAAKAAGDSVKGIVPGTATDPWQWLRDEPTAGDRAIVQAIHDTRIDLGNKQDDTTSSTDSVADKLPFDWSQVGVRSVNDNEPKTVRISRSASEEAREMERDRILRTIADHTGATVDTLRTVGVRAVNR